MAVLGQNHPIKGKILSKMAVLGQNHPIKGKNFKNSFTKVQQRTPNDVFLSKLYGNLFHYKEM